MTWKYSPSGTNAWYALPAETTDRKAATEYLSKKGVLEAHAEVGLAEFGDDGAMTSIAYLKPEPPKPEPTPAERAATMNKAAAEKLASFCLPFTTARLTK